VTEGYQPPTSKARASSDQETATLPRLSPGSQPSGSQQSGDWSPVSHGGPGSGSDPRATDDQSGGIGARLAAAASAAAATATAATSTARGAIKTAADQAEDKATRTSRRPGRGSRQPRRARLTLSHINVYSVFKFSCVLAIALFFVWLIMVGVLYGILDVAGVFAKINQTVHTISGDGKTNDVVTGSLVFGAAIIIGVVNIVLFIALSTIGAMIYNLCADLVGGAEVTLSERE